MKTLSKCPVQGSKNILTAYIQKILSRIGITRTKIDNVLNNDTKLFTVFLDDISRHIIKGLRNIDEDQINEYINNTRHYHDKSHTYLLFLIADICYDILKDFDISSGEKIFTKMYPKNHDAKQDFKKYMTGGLGLAIIDILYIILLRNKFKLDNKKSKKILYTNMNGGLISDDSPSLGELVDRNYDKNIGEILQEIDEISHKTKGACPFLKSKYKAKWINEMFDFMDNTFIPSLQKRPGFIASGDFVAKSIFKGTID